MVYIVFEDVVVYVEWVGMWLFIEVEYEYVVCGGWDGVWFVWGDEVYLDGVV